MKIAIVEDDFTVRSVLSEFCSALSLDASFFESVPAASKWLQSRNEENVMALVDLHASSGELVNPGNLLELKHQKVKVVIMSSKLPDDPAFAGNDLYDAFLRKPFSMSDFQMLLG